jgi:hypothetical protein
MGTAGLDTSVSWPAQNTAVCPVQSTVVSIGCSVSSLISVWFTMSRQDGHQKCNSKAMPLFLFLAVLYRGRPATPVNNLQALTSLVMPTQMSAVTKIIYHLFRALQDIDFFRTLPIVQRCRCRGANHRSSPPRGQSRITKTPRIRRHNSEMQVPAGAQLATGRPAQPLTICTAVYV